MKKPKRLTKRRAYSVLDALVDHEGEIKEVLRENGDHDNALHELAAAMRTVIDRHERRQR